MTVLLFIVGLKDDCGIVKFSCKSDLPRKTCQHLLSDAMSEGIKRTKVSQKLFVK